MKSNFLLLLSFLILTQIQGQETTASLDNAPRLNVYFNPMMVNYAIKADLGEASNQEELSFALGANFEYSIHGSSFLGIGIELSYYDFQSSEKNYDVFFPCDHNGSGGADVFSSWAVHEISIQYISLPIHIKQYFSQKKLGFYGVLTALPKFPVISEFEHVFYACGIKTPSGLKDNLRGRRIGLGIDLGLGITYQQSEKLHLFLEPSIEYVPSAMIPMSEENLGLGRPRSLWIYGVKLGMSFL